MDGVINWVGSGGREAGSFNNKREGVSFAGWWLVLLRQKLRNLKFS